MAFKLDQFHGFELNLLLKTNFQGKVIESPIEAKENEDEANQVILNDLNKKIESTNLKMAPDLSQLTIYCKENTDKTTHYFFSFCSIFTARK